MVAFVLAVPVVFAVLAPIPPPFPSAAGRIVLTGACGGGICNWNFSGREDITFVLRCFPLSRRLVELPTLSDGSRARCWTLWLKNGGVVTMMDKNVSLGTDDDVMRTPTPPPPSPAAVAAVGDVASKEDNIIIGPM